MKPIPCVASIAAVVAAAACSPHATSAPAPERRCQIVWSSPGGVTGTFDVYLVDLPISRWSSGTVSLAFAPGDVRVAEMLTGFDDSSGSFTSAALATSGTLTLTVAGTSSGDSVTLDDAGGHSFFDRLSPDELGGLLGSGGTASFQGVWSAAGDLRPGDPAGRASLTYLGSPRTLGDYARYATCYDPPPGG